MQTQENFEMCYRRENEVLDEKSLCGLPSQIDPLMNKLGYKDNK